MASDRDRYDRDRFPGRGDEGRDGGDASRREDDGYIARRGFGNRSAGYDRDRSSSGSSSDQRGRSDRSSSGSIRDDRGRSDRLSGGSFRDDRGSFDRLPGGSSGYDRGGSYRSAGGGFSDDDRGGISRSMEGGRSGFERGGSYRRDEGSQERDFGDSAGYGSGGSARDWRDVMGDDPSGYGSTGGRRGRGGFGDFMDDDRTRAGRSDGTGYDRSRERGYGGGHGAGAVRGGESGRYGASDFGRGSRGDEDERGFFERAGDEIRSWFGGEDTERRPRDAREGDSGARHHRGRGPKNYQRSDDRIRDDVNDRLTDDPHVDASEIEVTVQNREVTLTGTVNSRFEKRHAEDIAESVAGVAHVQNNLRLQQSMGMGIGGSALSGEGSSGGSGSGGLGGSGQAHSGSGSAGAVIGATDAMAKGSSTGSGTAGRSGARRRSTDT